MDSENSLEFPYFQFGNVSIWEWDTYYFQYSVNN